MTMDLSWSRWKTSEKRCANDVNVYKEAVFSIDNCNDQVNFLERERESKKRKRIVERHIERACCSCD